MTHTKPHPIINLPVPTHRSYNDLIILYLKFIDESNQTYSSNQFVSIQVSLIKNWFCDCSYYVQSLGVCIHGWKEISTPMSAGINTASNKPMCYIMCLSATWLSACSLLRTSHRSTWSPLAIFLNNSSIQKAANGTLSQVNDPFYLTP